MMNENHKRIVKNSAYMYIRMIFIMVISLYTSRIVLEILGVGDFGIYTLVGGIVSIFTVISGSLSGTVQRFLNIGLGEKDKVKTRSYFKQSLTLFAILFLLFLAIGETFGLWFVGNQLNIPAGREEATFWVYQFSLVAILFAILQIPFSGAVIARERMGFFAFVGIVDVLARLSLVLLLKFFGSADNLIIYALFIAIIQILQSLLYIFYSTMKFEECVIGLQWNRVHLKEILSYVGLSLFGNSVVTVTNQGVNVLLNLFGGALLNAATGVARQVNVAVLRLVECINTPIRPQIVKSYAAGEWEQMILLFEKNTKYTLLLMTVLLFPLILECDFILDIWLKDVPQYASLFTRIVLVESFFALFTYGIAAIIGATGKLAGMEVKGRLITLLVLPLSYLLLKMGAAPVAALLVSLAAQIIYTCYLFIDLKSKVDIPLILFFKRAVAPVILLILILSAVTIPIYLLMEESFLRFLVIGGAVVAVAIPSIWRIILDNSEREFVKRLWP